MPLTFSSNMRTDVYHTALYITNHTLSCTIILLWSSQVGKYG